MHCAPTLHRLGIFAFLILSPLLAQKSQNNPGTKVARDYSFAVPASLDWLDTGIDLQPGEVVYVYGGVIACGGTTAEQQSLPLPSAQFGALLAKVELEAPPVSASLGAELPIVIPGHLYLGINGNCSGKLPAKVHVERAPHNTLRIGPTRGHECKRFINSLAVVSLVGGSYKAEISSIFPSFHLF